MVKSLIIRGNHKVGRDGKVYLFNLPPLKTCTPSRWCLEGRDGKPACYALRNNFLLPSVAKSMEERYRASLQEDFIERMVFEIKKADAEFFRFHSSGDFYSPDYVSKVTEIVESCHDTLFRTTTRRRDLAVEIMHLNALPNMIVRESLDFERAEPEMGLPFAAIDNLPVVKEQESYMCPDSCPECGYYCWKEPVNINYKQH